MKSFFLTLPVALVLTSCSAPAEDNNPNNFLDTSANATSNATGSNTATTSNTTTSNATKAEAQNSATQKPAATYRVINEAQPGMPPEAVAALGKVKVPPPPAALKVAAKPRLRLATSKGNITIELDSKAAPLQVKSFVYLAGRKFFDGTQFHRYEPGFVIQGGDPLTKDAKMKEFYGVGGPGYQIPREYNNLKHKQFVVSAARSTDPDSAGSQFYITLADAFFLDQENSQDGYGYTAFGRVISGQDVVLKLRASDKLKSVTLLK